MNKAAIREQIKSLLNRNDATDAQVNTFIDQAVARIQRTLRVPSMEKVEIYSTTEDLPNTLSLPNDFLQLKHLYRSDGVIEYVDLGRFLKTSDAPGTKPLIYTRVQGSYLLKPTPPTAYQVTMVYYGEIPDLSEDTSTNFVTEIAPDLLVYGALTFAADFFVDDRKDSFEQIAVRIFNEVQDQAESMEFAQDGMAVNTAFFAPEY